MNNFTIEQMLYSNYIKYDNLQSMTNEVFVNSTANHVNIFIDMHSLIKGIYMMPSITIENYNCIASSMINLCAHLRHFYLSRYNVTTSIFIVQGSTFAEINKRIVPNYNFAEEKQVMEAKVQLRDLVNSNIELLEVLCPYLPDIFFINLPFEPGVLIQNIIEKNELVSHVPNIVITKDVYNYQLVTNPDTVVFRPHKSVGADQSYHINALNIYDVFGLFNRKMGLGKIRMNCNAGLFSFLLALSKVPERSIKSLYSTSKAMNIIQGLVDEYRIYNGYNSSVLPVMNTIDPDNSHIIESRFQAIDIIHQNRIFSTRTDACNIQFANLYDPEGVKKINNEYFKCNPLDLNRL